MNFTFIHICTRTSEMTTMHPRKPSLLRLERWFPRDIRVLIYSHMDSCTLVCARTACGMKVSICDARHVMNKTHVLAVYATFAQMFMLGGVCRLSRDVDAQLPYAVIRGDVAMAKYIYSIMPNACVKFDYIRKSSGVEMLEWLISVRATGQILEKCSLTAEMFTIAYNARLNIVQPYTIGRHGSVREVCNNANWGKTIEGCIDEHHWDILAAAWPIYRGDRNMVHRDVVWSLVRHAPLHILIACNITESLVGDHLLPAWLHSEERAAWVSQYVHGALVVAKSQKHAKWLIAHGHRPGYSKQTAVQPWCLDYPQMHREHLWRLPVEYYPRVAAYLGMPDIITSGTYEQIRWLHERGCGFSAECLETDCVDIIEYALSCGWRDFSKTQIAKISPETLTKMHACGWKPTQTYKILRGDTFVKFLDLYGKVGLRAILPYIALVEVEFRDHMLPLIDAYWTSEIICNCDDIETLLWLKSHSVVWNREYGIARWKHAVYD